MTTIDPTALLRIAGTRREHLTRADLDTALDALPALVAAYVEHQDCPAALDRVTFLRAAEVVAERDALRAEVERLTARVRNLARMRGETSARARIATVEPTLDAEDARLRALWPEPEPYQEGYLDGFDAARQYAWRALTARAEETT